MPELDAIDVILRIQNLRKFIADAEAAKAQIASIGKTAAASNAEAAGGAAGAAGKKGASASQAAALGLVRKAALGTGLAIAGIGFEATKMSLKFEEGMTRIITQAGESKKNLKLLENGVLGMTRSVAIGPQSLAEGLYHLESVGVRGQKALMGLKTAADLAGVGNANLEDTTTGLAAAFVTGIKGAGGFTHIAALMNAAVGSGNIRMQALAEALGQGILPAAKIAGLSLQGVFAALSTLTDAGWRASSASAQLATAFHYLYAPTSKAQKALAELHLTGLKIIEVMRTQGLPAALRLLKSHMDEFSKNPNIQAQQMAKIIPGGRGRTLLSLENMIPRLEQKEAFEQAATSKRWAEAVKTYHKTAAFQIKAAWAGVQADMVKIGKVLQPLAVIAAKGLLALADALLWLGKAGRDSIEWIKKASPPVKMMLTILGLFLGQAVLFVVMVRAWKMLTDVIRVARLAMMAFSTASKLALLTNPWAVLIMAIVALVVLMVTHWQQTKEILGSIWGWMKGAFKDTVDWIIGAAETVFNWFKKYWPFLAGILLGPFGIAIGLIIQHWNQFIKFFEGLPRVFAKLGEALWSGLLSGFKAAMNLLLIGPIDLIFHLMHEAYKKIPDPFGVLPSWPISDPLIPKLAGGGLITAPGSVVVGERGPELLHLPHGASVAPLGVGAGGGAGSVRLEAHTHVEIDKKVVAEAVSAFTSDKLLRR